MSRSIQCRLAIATIATACACNASAGPWQPFGIADRSPTLLVTHATTSGPVLALYDYGASTVVSMNVGATWRRTFTFDPSMIVYNTFAQVALVGDPPLFHAQIGSETWSSPDEGRSWAPPAFAVAPPIFPYQLGGFDPADGKGAVVFNGTSVAVTANGGVSWRVDTAPFTVQRLGIDWTARRMYAGSSSGFAGKRIDAPGPWITSAASSTFAASGGVVLVARSGRLERSTDGGASFGPVGQADGVTSVCAVGIAQVSTYVAYALTCDSTLFRSYDAGATWTPVNVLAPSGYPGGTPTMAIESIGWKLWLALPDGIHASVDGGVTLERLARSTGAPGVGRATYFDALDAQRLWAGGGPHPWRSTDGGATWEFASMDGRYVVWASRMRPNVVLSSQGTAFGKIALSVDGGETWIDKFTIGGRIGAAPTGPVVDGSLPGEVYLFQQYTSGSTLADPFLQVSTDDGESWAQRGPLPAVAISAAASRTAPTVVYFGGNVSGSAVGLFRSVDQGQSWAAVATLPIGGAVTAVAIDPTNASNVFAGFGTGQPLPMLRSTDGGTTWQSASSGLGAGAVRSIAIDPAQPSTMYVAQEGGGVFRSTDAGATWLALDEGLLGAAEGSFDVRIDPRSPMRIHLATDMGNFVADLATGAPAGTRRAIEYYHAAFNHYFTSADSDEIAGLDAGVFEGWARTGQGFRVEEGAAPGSQPVCRFFGVGFAPLSSHFYTPYLYECNGLMTDPNWVYEKIAFGIALPDASTRGCVAGTRPLYRLWNHNQRGAPNHRYSTSAATFGDMVSQGWTFEGDARTRVFACVPN